MRNDPPVRCPSVARKVSRKAIAPLVIGTLCVGTAVFAKMVDTRRDLARAAQALPPITATTMAPPVPLAGPRVVTATPFVAREAAVLLTATPPQTAYGLGRHSPMTSGRALPVRPDGFGGPTLVFDLFGSAARSDSAGLAPDQPAQEVGAARTEPRSDPTGDAIAAASAGQQANAGSVDERLAQRVGSKQADASKAQQMRNLDRLVPQGAIVGAVMETALNSDLPGYARALVTKDVLSFDGSAVLIPAGSRVIGEYNSGVAQGASRIFIVWSRLIRPDGVSIALGSPAVDDLGRGGLAGKVNRHFLQRFGGAILLSVLTGGINAAANSVSSGSTVIVNSSSEATSLLTQASRGSDIAPTIKTKQGALARIFVARDLDFSSVGPAR